MINTLKIGTVIYTIDVLDRLHVVDGSGVRFLNGLIEYHKCRIQFDEELPDQLRPIVVLHEAIHALLEQAGISEQDEKIVMTLGYGIAALIRDNPHFVDWLTKVQHEPPNADHPPVLPDAR